MLPIKLFFSTEKFTTPAIKSQKRKNEKRMRTFSKGIKNGKKDVLKQRMSAESLLQETKMGRVRTKRLNLFLNMVNLQIGITNIIIDPCL